MKNTKEHKKVYIAEEVGSTLIYGSQSFGQKLSRNKAKQTIINGIVNDATEYALENGYKVEDDILEKAKAVAENTKMVVSGYPIEEYREMCKQFPVWAFGIFK